LITAKYIVKNGAGCIIKSLNSVKDKVSEIIIVIDEATTDNTVGVVNKWYYDLGIINKPALKIFHHKWNGFAEQRNFALSKCTGDWILVIDADEVLETLELPDGDVGICKIRNVIKEYNLEPFDAIRIFRNLPQIKFEADIQATVEKSIKGLKAVNCNTLINHYGYDLTAEESLIKTQKNLKKHLDQFANDPDNLTVEFYISQCYRFLGDYRNAIDYGVLSLFKPLLPALKAMICINLFLAYNNLGLPHLGYKWLTKSLEYEPMQILGRALIVQILDQGGNTLLADEHFKIMQKIINDKNSKLPNDYYYSEAELINLRSKNNAS